MADLDLRIGINEQNFSSADMHFDDLQLWNIALTKDQIISYMVNPPSGDENNIVGYYNFDEIINGNQLYDGSNSSNNGIIYGASLNGIFLLKSFQDVQIFMLKIIILMQIMTMEAVQVIQTKKTMLLASMGKVHMLIWAVNLYLI